jgi:hypothetical protein
MKVGDNEMRNLGYYNIKEIDKELKCKSDYK